MKILLNQYKYAWSRDWTRFDRPQGSYYMEYLPLKALAEANGHSVNAFYFDEAILNYGREGAQKRFWEYILQEKPDVSIIGFNEYDVGMENFRKMRQQEFTTFVYLGDDDTWRWERVGRHFAKYFHWIVTYDSRAVKKYKSIGCKNIIHTQPGVGLETYKKLGREKDIDVSFMGTWSKPRGQVIKYLRASGINVLTRGPLWPEGVVSIDELIDIINRSKICLSLNTAPFEIGWRPITRLFFRRALLRERGLPIKLDIWNFYDNVRSLLMKRNRWVKSRNFEVPACGTMEMTQDADDLRDYYKLGEEIVVYKDNEDLLQKVKYYLAHPEEREEIARKGYERTIHEHSSEKRWEGIFEKIGHPIVDPH